MGAINSTNHRSNSTARVKAVIYCFPSSEIGSLWKVDHITIDAFNYCIGYLVTTHIYCCPSYAKKSRHDSKDAPSCPAIQGDRDGRDTSEQNLAFRQRLPSEFRSSSALSCWQSQINRLVDLDTLMWYFRFSW
ncbi:hypothetical protein PsorP6_003264 [Peronosclerospora sorghi]|uniref:Uncharacterized protein n=1 Tax=Peronosclerospora sorghi TaxID=230839 RepID=A0ACC0VMN9_9STRA|nr:hypothetical protein PsorP6_003264 [Peronosclerospora sorghi]